ncbi:MAG: HAD hydrolase family protein [Clostridium sp.]|nr:HAD hydrolase family protein [Clostridium sp.]
MAICRGRKENQLCILFENITVFGDQANDKEMFEKAGTKIAVHNANQELKVLADIVIESNDDDGVAQ